MLDVTVIRYLLVGLVNTAVGLSVIYFGMYALGLGNVSANVIGYSVGLLCSFVLNKRWTFAHEGDPLGSFMRFIAVVLLAYGTNLGTVLVAADVLGWNRYLAQALGIAPYTVVGYLGSRLFAFRSQAQPSASAGRLP